MAAPRYVVVTNPTGKRWQLYWTELTTFWRARGIEPEIVMVPWAKVIPRDGNLEGLPAFDQPALVRLESPGRDFEVTKLLLQAGSRDSPIDGEDWSALTYEKGRVVRRGRREVFVEREREPVDDGIRLGPVLGQAAPGDYRRDSAFRRDVEQIRATPSACW